MSARNLATCCLLICSLPAALSARRVDESATVSLRLRSGELTAATSDAMQRELAGLMDGVGVTAQWGDPASYNDVAGLTVVVDLQGECRVGSHENIQPVPDGTPIGSTATADNHLLPFVSLSCTTLSALVGPSLADQPAVSREFLYGRALGRVLAHELYHIVSQSQDHADSGVAKARFTAVDLVKPRFEFDESAAGRLHTARAEEPASAAVDVPRAIGFVDDSLGK